MDENLIEKKNLIVTLDKSYLLILFASFSVFVTCTVYTVLIYSDINDIKDTMMSVTDILLNTNSSKLNDISTNLEAINNCVLHKYCKRVPD